MNIYGLVKIGLDQKFESSPSEVLLERCFLLYRIVCHEDIDNFFYFCAGSCDSLDGGKDCSNGFVLSSLW